MRKSLLLPALLGAVALNAQIINVERKNDQRNLTASTVLVPLHYGDSLNTRIREAFQKYWNATPFVVCSKTDSVFRTADKKANFAEFNAGIISVYYHDNPSGQNYANFVLSLLNRDHGRIFEASLVSPINAFHYEWTASNNFDRSFDRVDYMVYNMNDQMNLLKDDKFKIKDYEDYVNKKATRLAQKTLLVPKELMSPYNVTPNTVAMMTYNGGKAIGAKTVINRTIVDLDAMASYRGKYKVMPFKDIEALSQSAMADKYALFIPTINDRKYVLVFDVKTKELIYTDAVKMSWEIKSKDMEAINKAAGF